MTEEREVGIKPEDPGGGRYQFSFRKYPASMLKAGMAIASILAIAFLPGCIFEKSPGEPSNEPLDSRLLGEWVDMENKDKADKEAFNVSEIPGQNRYKISVGDMELEAYKIDLPYQNLLELRIVKLGDSKQSGYFFCTYQITDERSLLLKVLFTPKEPLANRDEVREFLKRAIEEEERNSGKQGCSISEVI